MNQDELKKRAAAHALETYVESGMALGLGSGSTSAHFVRLLGEKVKHGLKVVGVPTSEATRTLANEVGVPLTTLADTPELDVAIDGADEVDPRHCLTKGGGGALLREKIVAAASKKFVVIVDASKRVDALGAFPLPIEVIPFAVAPVTRTLEKLGATPTLRQTAYGQPYTTDEGNRILDCDFGRITDPTSLAHQLDGIPGVVEHGLFIGLSDVVLVATPDGVETLDSPR